MTLINSRPMSGMGGMQTRAGGSVTLPNRAGGSMTMLQGQTRPGQGQFQCINPGNPFADVEVGMPNDPIPAHVCARMGVPEGSTWGHNAGEIRRMQQNAGMTFDGSAYTPADQGEITSTGMLGTQI